MLKNYFKIAFRMLRKNASFSIINIIGLGIGMAAFILISAYVNFEKSYDRMHADADNIYRVESMFYKGDQLTDNWPTSTNGYAKAMKENFPAITSFARINWNNSERVVKYNHIKFREEHVCFADTNFFSFFSYRLLKGKADAVLREPNSIVISASASKKYFGNENPVGKFLDVSTIGDSYHCMVTGVFDNVPPNSTMQFNFLMSWSTSPEWQRDFWYQHESYTFVKLAPNTDIPALEAKFPELAEKYKTGDALKELKWAIHLVPLTQVHLNAAKQYEVEVKGNRTAVGFLGIIAFVILIIANVNYINLSVSKALERAKEVGIRKVSGAQVPQLMLQFLLESFIINMIALSVALLLVAAGTHYLPLFTGNSAAYTLLFSHSLFLEIAFVFVASILLSGIYPAFILSRVQPISVLKGNYSFSKTGLFLRRALVMFQFGASILLIAGTLAVHRQLAFMQSRDIGLNIDQTLVIKAPVNTTDYRQKTESFKNDLIAMPSVGAVTGSGAIPGKEVAMFLANRRFSASPAEQRTYEMLKVDFDFIAAYGLKIVAGRAFDKSRRSDSTAVVLNESSVKQFGFSSNEAAIGEKVWLETNTKRPDEIIGVVQDYHQQSLQQKFTPIILFMDPAFEWIPTSYYSIRLKTPDIHYTIATIQKTWNSIFPASSFDFFFLNDYYNRQYQQEIQFNRVFMLFTFLAIFIACMGLFGLTAYAAMRRTREIGIRKVLGAPVRNIIALLTWESVKLILLSSVVALPLSYLFVQQWLRGYAFRAQVTWWQFVIPLVVLIGIAIGTIGYLTFRAAIANPVKSLRTE